MQDIRVILQIRDDNLLKDVINPLLKERKLSKLIVELLEAYYKDEYVNTATNIAMDNKDKSSREELIANLKGMRENIDALRFLNEDVKNLADEGQEFISEVEVAVEKEENQTEPKLLTLENYVTREEFNALMEGQNKILEILKGGSLFEKAKDTQAEVKQEPVKVKQEDKNEVKIEEKEYLLENENTDIVKESSNDGADIVNSLLEGMDFTF
jgi:hypothetical protein